MVGEQSVCLVYLDLGDVAFIEVETFEKIPEDQLEPELPSVEEGWSRAGRAG